MSLESPNFSVRKSARHKLPEMENEEVQHCIQDMEKSLDLNKQVLIDLISSKIPESDTGNIVCQLMKEVKNMETEYLYLLKECEDNQVKALIDEQISTEYYRKEQEFIIESEEKIADFIYHNDKKNKIINELSLRIKQIEEDSELYKKSRNMIVVPPTEDIIELHCQVEELKTLLSYEARNLYSLQSRKEKLTGNSQMLAKEVEKLKILLKNPMNRKYGIEHSNFSLKNDLSMEIVEQESSEDEIEEFGIRVLPMTPTKSRSQPLFELSLNRQHTLSFDIMTLSSKYNEEDEKLLLDINEHIDAMKGEILKITQELVKVSKENESLLENNEKLAQDYIKQHHFITIEESQDKKPINKSEYSRTNSNINEEVFKYIDN
jgi:hypothetical protein